MKMSFFLLKSYSFFAIIIIKTTTFGGLCMETSMQSVSLEYGDALFRLLKVKIFTNKIEERRITHNHQFYELHFALKGSYTYTVSGRQIHLTKDQFLIIPPSTPHIAVSNEGTDYEYLSLSLHLSRCDGAKGFYAYFKDRLDANTEKPLSTTPSLANKKSFLRLIGEQRNIIHEVCALKAYGSSFIYELFGSLDGYGTEIHVSPEADDADRFVLLEELVNHHTFSLSEIAKALGYSTRHTARIIKKTYGCNISELRKKHIISN